MENKKITVIVPIYNVEKYLHRSIGSIINQTYHNMEIILVNDGSTDRSGEICDEYASKDGRIKVIHKPNGGQASARNLAINEATGDWFAFLDSDDWIEPDMYETLYRIAVENNADIATCKISKEYEGKMNIEQNNDTGSIVVFTPQEAIMDLLHQTKIRFEVWNKLWKREVVSNTRFIDNQLCEEVHFDREVILRANRIVYIDKTMHHYMVGRPGSTMSSFKIKKMSIFDEFDFFIESLENYNNPVLGEVICCIATNFAISFYCEAIEDNQPQTITNELKRRFDKNYKIIRNSSLLTRKERIAYSCFKLSPTLYIGLLKIHPYLRRNRKGQNE